MSSTSRSFVRQLLPAAMVLLVFTVVCGVIYPLAVTGLAQLGWRHQANGSIVTVDGQAVGSSLIGQSFADPIYFHPRPSSAGSGYDGEASSASNLGPTSDDLAKAVQTRVDAYRAENDLSATQPVPVDAVTGSGSGLDPQISVANARLQAPRVALARKLDVATVLAAVDRATSVRPLGVLGDPGVNVLMLNVALDRAK